MHILIVPSWYPSKEMPLSGIFIFEQAQALYQAGYKVGVIVPPQLRSLRLFFKKNLEFSSGIEYENNQKIPIYRWHGWAWLPKVPYGNSKIFCEAGKYLFRRYVSEQGRPDIIHSHVALMGGFLGVKLKQRFGIPLVLTEHSSAFARNQLFRWQKKMASKTFSQADKCIVVSPKQGELLANQYPKNFHKWDWVPNLVSERFFISQQYPKLTQTKFRFLNVALMNENKGQQNLLYAFAESFKGNMNVELYLGGDGLIRNQLEQTANELGIKEQVVFLGMLTRQQVLEEMQQADVFVLSSHYETFGVVLVEALACGKPVIATACGGPECIVNDKNGLLVPIKDVQKLSKAMQTMYKKAHLYNPMVISQDCLARFGENAVVNKLTTIYNEVLSANSI